MFTNSLLCSSLNKLLRFSGKLYLSLSVYLDSNGFNTRQDVDERLEWFENRKKMKQPENWELSVFEEESDKIPDMFFNNKFCNPKKVKEDLTIFLSHPDVAKLFENI